MPQQRGLLGWTHRALPLSCVLSPLYLFIFKEDLFKLSRLALNFPLCCLNASQVAEIINWHHQANRPELSLVHVRSQSFGSVWCIQLASY